MSIWPSLQLMCQAFWHCLTAVVVVVIIKNCFSCSGCDICSGCKLLSGLWKFLPWSVWSNSVGCEKRFARPDHLKEHVRLHRPEPNASTTNGRVTIQRKISSAEKMSSARVLVVDSAVAGSGHSVDGHVCTHCKTSKFNSKEELTIHEQMCGEIPRKVRGGRITPYTFANTFANTQIVR